jgi:hypothetical protein
MQSNNKMIPQEPPPLLGFNTHRARIEHKLKEARHFHGQLSAKDERYRKLAKQKQWRRAQKELDEWMYCASAFISATRSTDYYINKATKRGSAERLWLDEEVKKPIHEIRRLRDLMLPEATPNTGFQGTLRHPRPGESKGAWVVRSLMVEPQNPSIALSVAGILPQLSAAAKRLAQQHGSNVSGLLSATMTGMLELVAEAESRKILSDDNIEPAVSTNMS